jgi:hypothetical protein
MFILLCACFVATDPVALGGPAWDAGERLQSRSATDGSERGQFVHSGE